MAIPPTAARFANPMDPEEVLDFVVPLEPVLETGEMIDPDAGRWSLVLLAEAVALGLEIIEGDPDWPDPALITGSTSFPNNTAIRFWARVDPDFQDNAAFQGSGTSLPMEVTAWTTSDPPRRRQRTFLLTVVEQ